MVWTVLDAQVDEVPAGPLGDRQFLAGVSSSVSAIDWGASKKVGRRAAYPLSLVRARESVRGRVVAGSATRNIHCTRIAGRGSWASAMSRHRPR